MHRTLVDSLFGFESLVLVLFCGGDGGTCVDMAFICDRVLPYTIAGDFTTYEKGVYLLCSLMDQEMIILRYCRGSSVVYLVVIIYI